MKQEDYKMWRHELTVPEQTLRGLVLGILFTILFTVSNLYLALKVGLTFSAAIPSAVLSMILLRSAKSANILENNWIQSQTAAAGTQPALIFVLPALVLLGHWQDFSVWQTVGIAGCGGVLGVLFTIPLRRVMTMRGSLSFPEGVAAAEVLKVGTNMKRQGYRAEGIKELLKGSGIAGLITFCMSGLHVLSTSMTVWLSMGRSITQIPLGFSPALVGVGYLLGMTSGVTMLIGLVIAWGGFVPYITMTETIPDGMALEQFADMIFAQKVRLIGAGALGVAALWTLLTLTFSRSVLKEVKEAIMDAQSDSAPMRTTHRTDTDLSMRSLGVIFWVTIAGLLCIFYSFVAPEELPPVQKVLFTGIGVTIAVVSGFLVTAAAAYMSGLVGSSSSPLSGVGILGIVVSSLLMYVLCSDFGVFDLPNGERLGAAIAIFTTAIIFAIACLANDNIQNLKTGHLVGATPWRQEASLIIGAVVGALVIGPMLEVLYTAYGFPGVMPRPDMDPAQALSVPQATLIATIAKGIFSGQSDFGYLYIGIGLGVLLIAVDVLLRRITQQRYSLSPLTVSMGIYLPPVIMTPILIGAMFSGFLHRRMQKQSGAEAAEEGRGRGTLFASGLVVGEVIVGLLIACVIVYTTASGGSGAPLAIVGTDFSGIADVLGLAVFIGLLVYFGKIVRGKNA